MSDSKVDDWFEETCIAFRGPEDNVIAASRRLRKAAIRISKELNVELSTHCDSSGPGEGYK